MNRRFDVIFFDCDSTLSTIEGIDELARRKGMLDEIAALTAQSMEGAVALEEIYGRRLDLVRPDANDLAWLGQLYVDNLTQGACELVAELLEDGHEIHILSGGLRPPLLTFAHVLGIAPANVHAVDVLLDARGSFSGWDRSAPTARSGGKPEVVRRVAAGRSCVMIGDGVTDLEAAQAGAFVIGFGGVVARDVVRAGADAWVQGPSLAEVLLLVR